MLDVTLAACKDYEPELWYSNHPFYVETAKLICNGDAKTPRCPMRDECREEGITRREWGIWGGLSEKDRAQLTGKLPLIKTYAVPVPATLLRLPIRQASPQRQATKETHAVPA